MAFSGRAATAFLAATCFGCPALRAQFKFRIGERKVQIHSFFSQGFAYSDNNNFLTMKTSRGSGAFTDGGVNATLEVTDHFRAGAQAYFRNIGQLGRYTVEVDWAYGDYKFKDWLGVRGGKVKTPLGLYNDTQDAEFVHTWAMLPQGLYPLDLRGNAIAHTGGDVYGEILLKKAGSLSYIGYLGARSFDPKGGYYFFSNDQGMPIRSISGRAAGGDLRWNTPLTGLTLGGSWLDQTQDRRGYYTFATGNYTCSADPQRTTAAYAEFLRDKWRFAGEFRRTRYHLNIVWRTDPIRTFLWDGSEQGWFLSAAYRINKRLEVGTYHSRYSVDKPDAPADKNSDHIHDQTVTVRVDLNRFWNVKVEGHFMDGYGDLYSAHGFYPRSNPGGFQPKTNMLVLRTGFSF